MLDFDADQTPHLGANSMVSNAGVKKHLFRFKGPMEIYSLIVQMATVFKHLVFILEVS